MKDIAQVVGSYIPLKEELRANCPFHKDTKRSFHVDVSTQKFRCLECGAEGQQCSVREALQGVSQVLVRLYSHVRAIMKVR